MLTKSENTFTIKYVAYIVWLQPKQKLCPKIKNEEN